jgi:hypothetical protein
MVLRRKFDVASALISLRPNSQWSLQGDNYEGLTWLDQNTTAPTKEEVLNEVERLQSEYDSYEYQRQRAEEYPSIQEQLDMLYWDKVNGTNNWQTTISEVKAKFSKNSE